MSAKEDALARLVPVSAPLQHPTVARSGPLAPSAVAGAMLGMATVQAAVERAVTPAGSATWSRTWRSPSAEQAVDVAASERDASGAAAAAMQVATGLRRRDGARPGPAVPGVPGAVAFRVASSPASPGAGEEVVVVLHVGANLAVVAVDAATRGPGVPAIVGAQAVVLAQAQYRLLAAAVPVPTTGRTPVLVVVAVGIAALLVPAAAARRRRLHLLRRGGVSRPRRPGRAARC